MPIRLGNSNKCRHAFGSLDQTKPCLKQSQWVSACISFPVFLQATCRKQQLLLLSRTTLALTSLTSFTSLDSSVGVSICSHWKHSHTNPWCSMHFCLRHALGLYMSAKPKNRCPIKHLAAVTGCSALFHYVFVYLYSPGDDMCSFADCPLLEPRDSSPGLESGTSQLQMTIGNVWKC